MSSGLAGPLQGAAQTTCSGGYLLLPITRLQCRGGPPSYHFFLLFPPLQTLLYSLPLSCTKVHHKLSTPKPAFKDLQDTTTNEVKCRNPADFSGRAACLNLLSCCYCQPVCWESRSCPWHRMNLGPWLPGGRDATAGRHLPAREEAGHCQLKGVSGCHDPLAGWLPLLLERGSFSLSIPYSFCRQNSSNSLEPHSTTFPKSSSARVIFLKIKMRYIRKEVEQRKANNLPRSQQSHPNAFSSSWEPTGGPASCLWILLYVALNQTHDGLLPGGEDARGVWDG